MGPNNNAVKFVITFLALFVLFYLINIGYLGLITPGSAYNSFLAHHFNYIEGLRLLLVTSSVVVLRALGFTTIHNTTEILVAGHGAIIIAYDCLGFGVMSFFAAFVIAYPKSYKRKSIFFILGILTLQLLNVVRLVLLAIFWDKRTVHKIDHHDIFNVVIYIIISLSLYFWIKAKPQKKVDAAN